MCQNFSVRVGNTETYHNCGLTGYTKDETPHTIMCLDCSWSKEVINPDTGELDDLALRHSIGIRFHTTSDGKPVEKPTNKLMSFDPSSSKWVGDKNIA